MRSIDIELNATATIACGEEVYFKSDYGGFYNSGWGFCASYSMAEIPDGAPADSTGWDNDYWSQSGRSVAFFANQSITFNTVGTYMIRVIERSMNGIPIVQNQYMTIIVTQPVGSVSINTSSLREIEDYRQCVVWIKTSNGWERTNTEYIHDGTEWKIV